MGHTLGMAPGGERRVGKLQAAPRVSCRACASRITSQRLCRTRAHSCAPWAAQSSCDLNRLEGSLRRLCFFDTPNAEGRVIPKRRFGVARRIFRRALC